MIQGNAIKYTPDPNFYGADSFSYTVSDGEYERFDYYGGVGADTAFEGQPDDATGLGGFGHLAVNIYEGVKLGVEGGISAVRVRGGEIFTRSDLRARLELPETRIRKWLLRQVDMPDEEGILGLGIERNNFV